MIPLRRRPPDDPDPEPAPPDRLDNIEQSLTNAATRFVIHHERLTTTERRLDATTDRLDQLVTRQNGFSGLLSTLAQQPADLAKRLDDLDTRLQSTNDLLRIAEYNLGARLDELAERLARLDAQTTPPPNQDPQPDPQHAYEQARPYQEDGHLAVIDGGEQDEPLYDESDWNTGTFDGMTLADLSDLAGTEGILPLPDPPSDASPPDALGGREELTEARERADALASVAVDAYRALGRLISSHPMRRR